MFEDINSHRKAVQEQIQKGFEIGFTESELEKAHKVGDIHPNGKWVWTQLPSGRYDWRVIKKTSAPAGGAAPATAQKKEISISANHPSLASVPGVQNIKDALTTYNSKYTDLSKVELIKTPKGNWDLHYDGHRLGIIAGSSISDRNAAKMGWIRNGTDDLTRNKQDEKDYEIGGKITFKNFDSFAKLVNSKKNNFYVIDTVGGHRHRGGRITSVISGSSGYTKIRIHWMGNGENEKKEFYSKDQAAHWLNGLDFDVEKKKVSGGVKTSTVTAQMDNDVLKKIDEKFADITNILTGKKSGLGTHHYSLADGYSAEVNIARSGEDEMRADLVVMHNGKELTASKRTVVYDPNNKKQLELSGKSITDALYKIVLRHGRYGDM